MTSIETSDFPDLDILVNAAENGSEISNERNFAGSGAFDPNEYANVVQWCNEKSQNIQQHYDTHMEYQKQKLAEENEAGLLEDLQQSLINIESDHMSDFACLSSSLDQSSSFPTCPSSSKPAAIKNTLNQKEEEVSLLKQLLLSSTNENYPKELDCPNILEDSSCKESQKWQIPNLRTPAPLSDNEGKTRNMKKIKTFTELLKHLETGNINSEVPRNMNASVNKEQVKKNETRLVNTKRYMKKYSSISAPGSREASPPKRGLTNSVSSLSKNPKKMRNNFNCEVIPVSVGQNEKGSAILLIEPRKQAKVASSNKTCSNSQANDHDYCHASAVYTASSTTESTGTNPNISSSAGPRNAGDETNQTPKKDVLSKVLKWEDYLQRVRAGTRSAPNTPSTSPMAVRGSARAPNNFMLVTRQIQINPVTKIKENYNQRSKIQVPLPQPLLKKKAKKFMKLQGFEEYMALLQSNLIAPYNSQVNKCLKPKSIPEEIFTSANVTLGVQTSPTTITLTSLAQRQRDEVLKTSTNEAKSIERINTKCTSQIVKIGNNLRFLQTNVIGNKLVDVKSKPISGSSGQMVMIQVPSLKCASMNSSTSNKQSQKRNEEVEPTYTKSCVANGAMSPSHHIAQTDLTFSSNIAPASANIEIAKAKQDDQASQSCALSTQTEPEQNSTIPLTKNIPNSKISSLRNIECMKPLIFNCKLQSKRDETPCKSSPGDVQQTSINSIPDLITATHNQTKVTATKTNEITISGVSHSPCNDFMSQSNPSTLSQIHEINPNCNSKNFASEIFTNVPLSTYESRIPLSIPSFIKPPILLCGIPSASDNLQDVQTSSQDISVPSDLLSSTISFENRDLNANFLTSVCEAVKVCDDNLKFDSNKEKNKESVFDVCTPQHGKQDNSHIDKTNSEFSDPVKSGKDYSCKNTILCKTEKPKEFSMTRSMAAAEMLASDVMNDGIEEVFAYDPEKIMLEDAVASLQDDEIPHIGNERTTTLSTAEKLFCKLPSYFLTGKLDSEVVAKKEAVVDVCEDKLSKSSRKTERKSSDGSDLEIQFNKLPHYFSSGKKSARSNKVMCRSSLLADKESALKLSYSRGSENASVSSEIFYSRLPTYYSYGRPHPNLKTFNDDVADNKDDTITSEKLAIDTEEENKRSRVVNKKKKKYVNEKRRDSSQVLYSKLPSYYLPGGLREDSSFKRKYSSSSYSSSSDSSSSYSSRSQKKKRTRSRRSWRHERSGGTREQKSMRAQNSDVGFDKRTRKKWKDNREQNNDKFKQQRAMEERRVVYVGRIDDIVTKDELRRSFLRFGDIETVSLHFRDDGDNYGFITFKYACDAFRTIEEGNSGKHQDLQNYDFCFGGRRQFCKTAYEDLDSKVQAQAEASDEELDDFDALLREAKRNLRK